MVYTCFLWLTYKYNPFERPIFVWLWVWRAVNNDGLPPRTIVEWFIVPPLQRQSPHGTRLSIGTHYDGDTCLSSLSYKDGFVWEPSLYPHRYHMSCTWYSFHLLFGVFTHMRTSLVLHLTSISALGHNWQLWSSPLAKNSLSDVWSAGCSSEGLFG